MKKLSIFFLILLLIPSFVFSVNNAKINGQKEIVITQLPAEIIFTCDLAQAGNKLAFEYYVDIDRDGQIGPAEEIQEFFYVTDGIGWIRDPENSDNDLAGDETGVDGKLKVTFFFEPEEVFIPTGIYVMVKVLDEDGSTDMVKMTLQIQPQPPFIHGKITDANTGVAIQNIFVIAEMDEESNFGISDVNGDYIIPVSNGTYKVVAMEFPAVNYQMSDTASVTVSDNQTVTQNFQLQPYTTFVQGKLSKEDGSPVPGIIVVAVGGTAMDIFSMAVSDNQGNYKIGVQPGLVAVGANALFNQDNENWPKDFYADPAVDSLNIAEGQTATSDFVFKPYSSFVTGKCTVNGTDLAGVQISGLAFDFTSGQIYFYETYSDQTGNYRLGVHPGTLTTLTAEKEGYNVTSPIGGMYMQIEVAAGQTVSGKDYEFSPFGTIASISGIVTFNNGSPASNVYVVAENSGEESPEGFLITYTDGSGNYLFENVLDGNYQVGVYYEGYSSNPAMIYFYLWGAPMIGQDFVLSEGTGIESKDSILKPGTINLTQNFPNPFNPTTTIGFDLPAAAQVEINIFNANGQKIRTLVNRDKSAGLHQVEWDSRNDAGEKVTSGVYLYQLKTNNYTKVKKMILAK